jgi:hypothetical protein
MANLVKIGSGIQKLMGRGDKNTDTQHSDLASLGFLFKESRLKMSSGQPVW